MIDPSSAPPASLLQALGGSEPGRDSEAAPGQSQAPPESAQQGQDEPGRREAQVLPADLLSPANQVSLANSIRQMSQGLQGDPANSEGQEGQDDQKSRNEQGSQWLQAAQDLTAGEALDKADSVSANDKGDSTEAQALQTSAAQAPAALEPAAQTPAIRSPRRFFLNWPRLVARWYSLYSKTVGLRYEGYPFDLDGPVIFTVWHSVELSLLPRFGDITKGVIIVSNSKDGDILSAVVSRWGYSVIRGSSSKGAVRAVLSLKRELQAGHNIIMAVDGPRGPHHEAKPGAYWLAAKTGRPICPVGAAVSRAHVFNKSWSKSMLPLPFSRLAATFGDLIWLGRKDLELDADAQCAFLTGAMRKVMADAQNLLKIWPDNCSDCGKRPAGRD